MFNNALQAENNILHDTVNELKANADETLRLEILLLQQNVTLQKQDRKVRAMVRRGPTGNEDVYFDRMSY